MPELKTLEEHCGYVERLARLSFYFARKHLVPRFPEERMSFLLLDHTPILYHGLNYPPEVWQNDESCRSLLAEADRRAALPPEEFEEAMWAYAAPLARRRAEANYPFAVGVQAPPSWNCGSLKYDRPDGKKPEGWVNFHIANAVGPHSIFDDPHYLPRCFELLMKETEIRFNSNVLTTGTWLNDRADWLAFFPQEWHDNLSPRPEAPPVPRWHFGSWGQLVTARGTVNPKAEQFVRENGFLKYVSRSSHCSFENMRKHLKELL